MNNLRPVLLAPFSPTSLACLRSWGEKGLSPGFICIRKPNDPPPGTKYLHRWYSLPPGLLFSQQGLEKIEDFLLSFNASGLMCINEQVACWLGQKGLAACPLWSAKEEVLRQTMSKTWQLSLARKVGLAALKDYYFGPDLCSWPKVQAGHFPLCLRPAGPDGPLPPFKVKIVPTEEKLLSFLHGLQDVKGGIIAQPFLHLPNLVVHGACTVSGEAIGLQAFLVERKFEGVTLTIRPHPLSPGLGRKCTRFVQEAGLTGPFHFEFLYDSHGDQAWFLELNPRFGGTTAKVFALGYDEPGWALQACWEQEVVREQDVQGIATSKIALVKYLLHTLQGRLTPLDYPQEPAWRRLAFACRAMLGYKDDVFSAKDWPGTFFYYWAMLKTRLPGA